MDVIGLLFLRCHLVLHYFMNALITTVLLRSVNQICEAHTHTNSNLAEMRQRVPQLMTIMDCCHLSALCPLPLIELLTVKQPDG